MFKFNSQSRALRIIFGWVVILTIFAVIFIVYNKSETVVPVLTILSWLGVIIIIVFILGFISEYVRKKAIVEEENDEKNNDEIKVRNKFFFMLHALFTSSEYDATLSQFGLFKAIGIILAVIIAIYFIIIFGLKIFSPHTH